MLLGPRATGKTTTARRFARTVVRLDSEVAAVAFRADPDAALRGLDEPVLLDEWQAVPGVLAAVKRAVDDDPRPGRYLLTGSVRGDVEAPTWPGTGRLMRLTMYGLTVREASRAGGRSLIDRVRESGIEAVSVPHDPPDLRGYVELALRGGFPEMVEGLSPATRSRWMTSYVEQLVTRDATQVDEGRDPVRLRRYLEALAIHTGCVVEDRTLFEAAGIDKKTAAAYERLFRSLLVRILETFVVSQIRPEAAIAPTPPRLYHLRAEQGRHEVNLVAEFGAGDLIAFEIKADAAPRADAARHLTWLRDAVGERFLAGLVLHTGRHVYELDRLIWAVPACALWSP